MLVLTSSVILLVIVAVTARRNGATNQAQAILDRRLAAGEIDDTGHRERTAPLTHQAQDADRGPRRAIIDAADDRPARRSSAASPPSPCW